MGKMTKITLQKYIENHRRNIPALTILEAKIVGLKWPLKKRWYKDNMHVEFDLNEMLSAKALKKKRISITPAEKKVRRDRKENLKTVKKFIKIEISSIEFEKAKEEYEYANNPGFLLSYEWRQLRFKALQKYGRRCQCCGATPEGGATINVDHVRSRRNFPHLALELDNLQILCAECNHGKGNQTVDFR